MTLLQAMALAANRDRIARRYHAGYAELRGLGLAALPPGFALVEAPVPVAAVQAVYLA